MKTIDDKAKEPLQDQIYNEAIKDKANGLISFENIVNFQKTMSFISGAEYMQSLYGATPEQVKSMREAIETLKIVSDNSTNTFDVLQGLGKFLHDYSAPKEK